MKMQVMDGPFCAGDTARVIVTGCDGLLLVEVDYKPDGAPDPVITLTDYGFDVTAYDAYKYTFKVSCCDGER